MFTQHSSADNVDLMVREVATYGAAPQLGKDPVYIASQIDVALRGIISREKEPLSPGVVTVGPFCRFRGYPAQHSDLIPRTIPTGCRAGDELQSLAD